MKRQIRFGVFETNSSSTHVFMLLNEQDYKDWKENKKYLCKWEYRYKGAKKNNLYTKDEIKAFADKKGYTLEEVLEDQDFVSFDDFGSDECDEYEWFDDEITTPSGDKVYALGYYGYDG